MKTLLLLSDLKSKMSNTYLEELFTSHYLKNLIKEPTCLETQKHVATTF